MRILFSTVPVLGHFLPMTPLVDAARQAGHEVAVASGSELELEVKRLGVEFWPAGPDFPAMAAMPKTVLPETASPAERIAVAVTEMFVPAARDRASDLVRRALDWHPNLVVHEPTELAGAIAAEAAGARHVVHGLGVWPDDIWSLFAPGYASLCAEWRVADRFLAARYLDVLPRALSPVEPAGFAQVIPLRPVAPPVALEGVAMPRRYPDTVYLTLGTIFHDAPDVFSAVLDGLSRLPVNVVVTVGPGADPAVVGAWPPHVHVTDYVPQELVLPHCRVAIHHGGAGSMLGALRHGLPQLVLPRGADNFHNATLVRAAGAGLSLAPFEVSASAVADAVAMLLLEPGFSDAARTIAQDIAAMLSPAEVLARLTT